MDGDRPVLYPTDESNLARDGLLGRVGPSGLRKLHRRRAYDSSEEEYRELPLNPINPNAASTGQDENLDDNAFVEIPSLLISRPTLLYAGFTEAKATELWSRWTNWPANGPRREVDPDDGRLAIRFVDFATGHIGAAGPLPNDTFSTNNSDWTARLQGYGLDASTIRAIMDPAFDHVRQRETAAHWAKDTVEMRLAGLYEINRESTARATGGSRGLGRPRGQSSSSAGDVAIRTAIQLATESAPGHTILYKGIDKARTRGLFDSAGRVANFQTLVSSSPSDFSGNRAKYYFTPQFPVAEYYAAYAKRRTQCEAVVIIAIKVPNRAIESLTRPEIERVFWPNPDWASLVWHCRQNLTLPKDLRRYRDTIVTIGHTAKRPNDAYARMPSPAAITDQDVLREDGHNGRTMAVQYVFSDEDEGREWLWSNGAQTARAFPFAAHDLEVVVRDSMSVGAER